MRIAQKNSILKPLCFGELTILNPTNLSWQLLLLNHTDTNIPFIFPPRELCVLIYLHQTSGHFDQFFQGVAILFFVFFFNTICLIKAFSLVVMVDILMSLVLTRLGSPKYKSRGIVLTQCFNLQLTSLFYVWIILDQLRPGIGGFVRFVCYSFQSIHTISNSTPPSCRTYCISGNAAL